MSTAASSCGVVNFNVCAVPDRGKFLKPSFHSKSSTTSQQKTPGLFYLRTYIHKQIERGETTQHREAEKESEIYRTSEPQKSSRPACCCESSDGPRSLKAFSKASSSCDVPSQHEAQNGGFLGEKGSSKSKSSWDHFEAVSM